MKRSEFAAALRKTFGDVLGPSYVADVVLPGLQLTAEEALAAGWEPRVVWQALVTTLDRPEAVWVHQASVYKKSK